MHLDSGEFMISAERYDALEDGVTTADFTGYPGWEGYEGWSWRLDSLTAEARYEGACSDVATLLGVSKVDQYIDLYTWGIGWGPMTADLSSAYTDLIGEPPGDDQGAAYLEWSASGSLLLNTWSLFKVYPLIEGTHFDPSAEPYPDVGSSTTPYDGYYENTIFYRLTFSK